MRSLRKKRKKRSKRGGEWVSLSEMGRPGMLLLNEDDVILSAGEEHASPTDEEEESDKGADGGQLLNENIAAALPNPSSNNYRRPKPRLLYTPRNSH
jgi:hypothetical protein